jgi:hypothetical protein
MLDRIESSAASKSPEASADRCSGELEFRMRNKLLQSARRACYRAPYFSCSVERDQSAGSTLADPGISSS